MNWKELKLDEKTLRALREDYGIDEPELVIKLAWGAPDLLGKVVSKADVERLRESFPPPEQGSYDSSGFSLGARFGSPSSSPLDDLGSFEEHRASILEQLEQESSPHRRAALEDELQKLYRHD